MRRSLPNFLVMVPHRDARLPLRAWSGALFAAGLPGAWSFPWVAPLAALDGAISDEKLKPLARALREISRPSDGKFAAGALALAAFPFFAEGEDLRVFGPHLDIALDGALFELAEACALRPISPVVLGAALLRGPAPGGLPPPPPVSFRAAALAVMRFRPLDLGGESGGYSFEWEIGKLRWLPK